MRKWNSCVCVTAGGWGGEWGLGECRWRKRERSRMRASVEDIVGVVGSGVGRCVRVCVLVWLCGGCKTRTLLFRFLSLSRQVEAEDSVAARRHGRSAVGRRRRAHGSGTGAHTRVDYTRPPLRHGSARGPLALSLSVCDRECERRGRGKQ